MDRQDIQTRRAENQVWNGSGAYDTKPELLVFDGGGDADLYGNTVLGLAGRYYRFDLFRPLLNDFHRSVQEGLYTDVFFFVLENAVFRRGAQERPILPALRAAYARTLLRDTPPAEGMTDAALVEAAALAESWSKHPISLSIKAAYGKPIDAARVTDVQELGGHGVTAKVDGRTVAAGNARLMEKLGITVPAVEGVGTIVHVAVEGSYAGYLLIADVVKPHSADAIRALKASGVRKTVMLTGDAQPVAQAVAQQLSLDEYHAGLLPGDKVDQIEKLLAAKQPKENLAFVGDGINDAPVLSRADVGIAMGALGSDAAIEAADVVLMDDDPAKIALAMRIARRTLRIVHQNIVFALGIKALCLLLGALGIAGMWAAIFADVGVMVIAVLNATRALYTKDLAGK